MPRSRLGWGVGGGGGGENGGGGLVCLNDFENNVNGRLVPSRNTQARVKGEENRQAAIYWSFRLGVEHQTQNSVLQKPPCYRNHCNSSMQPYVPLGIQTLE